MGLLILRALAFGEEESIGHHHPLAFEALERQQNLARTRAFLGADHAQYLGPALRIDLGQHLDGRLHHFLQPLSDRGWNLKAQRHIVALHQRARIDRLQWHQNALTMGNHLLLAAHIPVHRAKHQQCTHHQQRHASLGPALAANHGPSGLGRSLLARQKALHPQAHEQQGTQHGQTQPLISQRPLQAVIKPAQQPQPAQRAKDGQTPAPRAQSADCNHDHNRQRAVKARSHGQQQRRPAEQKAHRR